MGKETVKSFKWISVDESVPTDCCTVLVWVIGSPIHFDEDYIEIGCYVKGGWICSMYVDEEKEVGDVEIKVSHWMHIDPPKGKKYPEDCE